LPVAVTDDRVTFRYIGVDGVEQFTHVAFSEPAEVIEPVEQPLPDGSDSEPPSVSAGRSGSTRARRNT
jgi:hypothetical protein